MGEKLASKFLNEEVVCAACKAAKRSPLKLFQTGAVIYNKENFEIVCYGTSHNPIESRGDGKRSVHAEDDALNKIRHIEDKSGLGIFIYTISRKSGNMAGSSRPCNGCATRLQKEKIHEVTYLERCNDNSWALNREQPKNLIVQSIYER